jgi:CHAT domain-containing protein/tetratricopeptide (TPR) repeat protein
MMTSTFHQIVKLENKAATAQAAQNHDQAVQAHANALEIAQKLNRPRLVAVLYHRLGETFEVSNQVQSAVIAYESGLKALRDEPHSDLDWVIDSLYSSVKGFDPAHRFMEVLDLYSEETSEDLIESENDPHLAVKLLINIGNAYLRQPQMNPALNAYEQALKRPEIVSAPLLRAHALTHIAIIHRRTGDIDAASNELNQALDILDLHPDPLEKRRALSTLASIFRERGETTKAQKTFQQALELYQQTDDPLGEARVLASLGHIDLDQHKYLQAKSFFERAVNLAQQVGDEDTLWHASWGLGRCQYLAGELEDAAQSFRRSLDKIKSRQRELRTDEGKVTFLESVQDIYDHLIEVYLEQALSNPGVYSEALRVVEEARGQAMFELMGVRRRHFPSRQAGFREARLRTHGQRWDTMVQSAPGIPSSPLDFSPMSQMAPAVQSAASINIGELLDDPVWGEDTISISDMVESAQAVPSSVPHWPTEQENDAQPTGEDHPKSPPLTRLVYHVLSGRTAVIVVKPDGTLRGAVIPIGREALADRVAEVRKALQVEVDPRDIDLEPLDKASLTGVADYTALLKDLFSDLVGPITETLPTNNEPIVIEPHGPLWLLPFAALISGDGTHLTDHWPLLYSPSQQVIEEIQNEPDYGGPNDLKPLIVGNPALPGFKDKKGKTIQLRPLPGAEVECQAIFNLLAHPEGKLLLGASADWASVITQIPQHGILHFATHGLANSEEPLDSLIALALPEQSSSESLPQHPTFQSWPYNHFVSDFFPSAAQNGMLTARQIVYLPVPADLVTLSACQTGLGQISGDGVIGLSRSFLVAGARSVLVSLWNVNDQATAALMTAFYQAYIELDDKALALQKAMIAVRSMPGFEHPRYWAPFLVVGVTA